jgi:hypothetical protein
MACGLLSYERMTSTPAKRAALLIASVLFSACRPQSTAGGGAVGVDAGSPDAAVAPDATTAPDAGGTRAAAPNCPETGARDTSVPFTTGNLTCTDPAAASATLGNGFNAVRPAACDAPGGAPVAVTSAAQMASLVVGLLYDCDGQLFGLLDQNVPAERAVELTCDGRYIPYTFDDNLTLVPQAPLVDAGPAGPPLGTFTVVDGTATYGPGTFELQFHPAQGGLFAGQVVVTDDPPQVQYFPINEDESVFARPLPWSMRKGVCSCVNTTETPAYADDPVALANAIVGKWMWCAGKDPPAGTAGIEFATSSTWYPLDEDANGTVTRGAQGTFSFAPTMAGPTTGPEPLTLFLETAGSGGSGSLTQIEYFPDPRVLFFGTGTTSTGNGPLMNTYSACMPMP